MKNYIFFSTEQLINAALKSDNELQQELGKRLAQKVDLVADIEKTVRNLIDIMEA